MSIYLYAINLPGPICGPVEVLTLKSGTFGDFVLSHATPLGFA